MVSPYPGGFDTFTPKIDHIDLVMAQHVNELQDGIEAIEPTLGANPQGTAPDVVTRLNRSLSADGYNTVSRIINLNGGYGGGLGMTSTVTGDLSMNGSLIVDGTITASGGILLSGTTSQYWRVDNTDASATTEDFQFGIAGRYLRWNKGTSRFELSGSTYIPTLLEIVSASGTNALTISSTSTVNPSYGINITKTGIVAGSSYGISSSTASTSTNNYGGSFTASGAAASSNTGVVGYANGAASWNIAVQGSDNGVAAGGSTVIGVQGIVLGNNATNIYGGSFVSNGIGAGTNYGIYATATGGATNWAGYFVSGNVYVKNKTLYASVDTVATTAARLRVQEADSLYTYTGSIATLSENSSASVNNVGVLGAAQSTDNTMIFTTSGIIGQGIIGINACKVIGVEAQVKNAGLFQDVVTYGVYSDNNVSNIGTGFNYGIYSAASGATTNYAGWFEGLVYINQTATTGTTTALQIMKSGAATYGYGIECSAVGASAGNCGAAINAYGGTVTCIGVQSLASGSGGTADSRGVYARTNSTGTNSYGTYCEATGAATTNYGIYSTAAGAATNWAGYFTGGGTSAYTYVDGLSVNQISPAGDSYLEVYNNLAAYSIKVDCPYAGGRGIYITLTGLGSTGNFGVHSVVGGDTGDAAAVLASCTSTGTNSYGTYCEATGAATTNYGIYSTAAGAATNWAGYFGNGNVFIANTAMIGSPVSSAKLAVWGSVAGKAIDAEASTNGDVAIQGFSQGVGAAANYGVLGYAVGSTTWNIGVYGGDNGGAAGGTNVIGVSGSVSSTTGTNVYGGYFNSAGAGSGTNYGVYATASGATTNYAGYFSGNVTNLLGAANKLYINALTTPHTDTNGALKIELTTLTDGVNAVLINSGTTTTTGGTLMGVQNIVTCNTAVTAGNQYLYGDYNSIVKISADSTVDTITVYGSYNAVVQSGSTNVGTKNTYGGYFSATGDTAGISTTYGIYSTASGADTNYAGYFNGNVKITGKLTVDGAIDPTWMALTPGSVPGSPANGMIYYDSVAHSFYFYQNGGWITAGGGVGAPGGLDTAVQFNNGGLFGGDATSFAWDNTNKQLTVSANNSMSDSKTIYITKIGAPMGPHYGVYSSITGGPISETAIYATASGTGQEIGLEAHAIGTVAGSSSPVAIFATASGDCPTAWGASISCSAAATIANYGVSIDSDGGVGSTVPTCYGINIRAHRAATTNYGVYSSASGATTGYGGYFRTEMAGTIGYGIYSEAVDAPTCYAGYFIANSAVTTNYSIYAYAIGAGTNYSFYGLAGQMLNVNTYSNNVGAVRTMMIDSTGLMGYNASSIRYKENVIDMENIDWVYNLRPVNYNRKNDLSKQKEYGLIAEEVAEVCKELIVLDEEGKPDSVEYYRIVPVLLKAIQELKKEISELKNQRMN